MKIEEILPFRLSSFLSPELEITEQQVYEVEQEILLCLKFKTYFITPFFIMNFIVDYWDKHNLKLQEESIKFTHKSE